VTASFIHIDTNTGKLKFARAGHFPLYIIRATSELVTMNSSGRAITAYFPTNAKDESIQLIPGDMIVLLTDGLTEASRPNEVEMYGEEQLLQLITDNREKPLTEIRDLVFDVILDYSGGIEMVQDDLTLALIRYKNN